MVRTWKWYMLTNMRVAAIATAIEQNERPPTQNPQNRSLPMTGRYGELQFLLVRPGTTLGQTS